MFFIFIESIICAKLDHVTRMRCIQFDFLKPGVIVRCSVHRAAVAFFSVTTGSSACSSHGCSSHGTAEQGDSVLYWERRRCRRHHDGAWRWDAAVGGASAHGIRTLGERATAVACMRRESGERKVRLEYVADPRVFIYLYEFQTLEDVDVKIYRKIDKKSGQRTLLVYHRPRLARVSSTRLLIHIICIRQKGFWNFSFFLERSN